jgi:hypothetical protein
MTHLRMLADVPMTHLRMLVTFLLSYLLLFIFASALTIAMDVEAAGLLPRGNMWLKLAALPLLTSILTTCRFL